MLSQPGGVGGGGGERGEKAQSQPDDDHDRGLIFIATNSRGDDGFIRNLSLSSFCDGMRIVVVL